MRPVEPVFVVGLFPGLHAELVALLRSLGPAHWGKPTACSQWCVRDVVAHLLDGDIRKLSCYRDGTAPPPPEAPIAEYQDLVAYLNELNAEWVRAARRVSPSILVDFLAVTGPQVSAFFETLDPDAPAVHPVAWAGDEVSPNWFDIGREYTERWHHQQQIRDAVGAPGLTAREWLYPVLDLFARALPYTYRHVEAAPGQAVSFVVTGEAGGSWSLVRKENGWNLYTGDASDAATRVTLDQDAAWRLYCKGLSRDAAAGRVHIAGDRRVGEVFLGATAVMA